MIEVIILDATAEEQKQINKAARMLSLACSISFAQVAANMKEAHARFQKAGATMEDLDKVGQRLSFLKESVIQEQHSVNPNSRIYTRKKF